MSVGAGVGVGGGVSVIAGVAEGVALGRGVRVAVGEAEGVAVSVVVCSPSGVALEAGVALRTRVGVVLGVLEGRLDMVLEGALAAPCLTPPGAKPSATDTTSAIKTRASTITSQNCRG